MRVVVVGASSGIGAAVAIGLHESGHVVNRLSRTEGAPDLPGRWTFCDVHLVSTIVHSMSRLAIDCKDPVDALVYCVGSYGEINPVRNADRMEWLDTFNLNVVGFLNCIKHIPVQKRIIGFAGGGAFNPLPHFSAYACSKAAIVRLVETVALEVPRVTTVNAIAPGLVDTPIHERLYTAGAHRAGQTYFDIRKRLANHEAKPVSRSVDLVKYLLSDEAADITGRTISANFDPWDQPGFAELLRKRPTLYTMRRVEI